jgi:hypothetical protein
MTCRTRQAQPAPPRANSVEMEPTPVALVFRGGACGPAQLSLPVSQQHGDDYIK